MKTLLITEVFLPDTGGSINIYHNVYMRFNPDKVFILTKKTRGWQEFDRNETLPIYRVSLKRYLFLKPESLVMYIKLLIYSIKIVLNKNIDIVHCGRVIPEGLIGLIIKRIIKRPYIVYAHGEEITIYRNYRIKNRLMPIIYNSAQKIIANSSFTKNKLLEAGVETVKIEVVNPGVDINQFKPEIDPTDIIEKYALKGKKVLLTVGRLTKRKGHSLVIKSLLKVVERIPTLVYLITGTGEEEFKLKELVRSLGLDNQVKFVGYVEDGMLPKYYAACDVFIMANRELSDSDVEGFGIVFLEANACGKPVIGGNSGGTGDSIQHGVTGLRINVNNQDEISEAIIKLFEDIDFAKQLGMNGRNRVVAEFNWDRGAEKIKMINKGVALSKNN